MVSQYNGVQIPELDANSTYDSIELVPVANWCIERSGAPLGKLEDDTDGFFGVTARFGPRINTVMIGFRHYGPAVAYRALDNYAEKHLRPHGILHQLVFNQHIHTYPYIVLSLTGLQQWVNCLRGGYVASGAGVPLYTLPTSAATNPVADFMTPLTPDEIAEQTRAEAEREYPDPHDQPPPVFYPRRQHAIACTRLREALGVDAYQRGAREGWHVEGRGRFAALRLGGRDHTLDEVHYVFEHYGIAASVAYGGYELSVDPDNTHNAPFRIS